MKRSLRERTVSGLGWAALSQVAKQASNVLVSLVLARLTGPAAFGLIGMVTIFTGFASLFVDLGLGSGLVQRSEVRDEHVCAAFWVNFVAGIALAALLAGCAPLAAAFYHQPAITVIMRVLSIGLLLSSTGTVQSALLTREMRFRELARIELSSTALSGVIGIAAAFYGLGVWSLVVQSLSQSCAKTVGLWSASRWRPGIAPRFDGIKDLAHFSSNLFAFNVLNYWVRNLDNLLIGKFVGNSALGIYSRAYQLMLLPVQQITGVSGNVLFPAMASVQNDIPRVRNIYLRAISTIHLVSAPIYGGLFALADTFVLTVLGTKWLPVVPLLRIFCIVGVFQPVGSSIGWIYTAMGRSDIMMKWGVFTAVLYIIGFFIGLKWGLIGVTWSYCIAGLIAWYPGWTLAGRVVDLNFSQMLLPLIPSSLCAMAMAGAVWIIGYYLKGITATPIVFLLQSLGGAIFYLALVVSLRLDSWQQMLLLRSPSTGN